mmetsp:Transcript_78589/g.109188  ORF Transcript_78589/g.109188 Transcript_78589/m.109188 type:complete len:202 (+) Transcript_78589:122-727(+)
MRAAVSQRFTKALLAEIHQDTSSDHSDGHEQHGQLRGNDQKLADAGGTRNGPDAQPEVDNSWRGGSDSRREDLGHIHTSHTPNHFFENRRNEQRSHSKDGARGRSNHKKQSASSEEAQLYQGHTAKSVNDADLRASQNEQYHTRHFPAWSCHHGRLNVLLHAAALEVLDKPVKQAAVVVTKHEVSAAKHQQRRPHIRRKKL